MRKYYLDNIRWVVIVLVLINHVVSIFSSNGSLMSYNAPGIPAMDTIGYFIYPWFMPCLFVVGGMSARYSLQRRSNKEFLKERIWKLLIPFISYIVLIGPFAAGLDFRVNHRAEQLSALPGFVVSIIKVLNGMGPSWFLIQMFIISLILMLIRHWDKNDRLSKLGQKVNMPVLLLCYIPVFGAAQVLYVAYTFRNALYLLLFLMGYYIFSEERIQQLLEKYSIVLLCIGAVTGIVQAYISWGISYQLAVNNWAVMLYTWIMILAVLGAFRRWFNFSNKFTAYMNKSGFGFYLFHYVPMVYGAYYLTTLFTLPYIWNYVLVFVLSAAASVVLYEIISRIPVLNTLFGIRNEKYKHERKLAV
jgi:Uncharacterized protein conserved in bacteria